MSALVTLGVATDSLTRYSTDSSDELSWVLMVVSAVAIAGAGLGLVFVCARALFFSKRMQPVEPWITQALAAPTVHTRAYVEAQALAASAVAPAPLSGPLPEAMSEPVFEPLPPTLRRPEIPPPPPATLAVAEVPAMSEAPPPSNRSVGPTSTDPTVEMDLSAFPARTRMLLEGAPADEEPTSGDTEVFTAAPIPLVARHELSNSAAEEPAAEPPAAEPPAAEQPEAEFLPPIPELLPRIPELAPAEPPISPAANTGEVPIAAEPAESDLDDVPTVHRSGTSFRVPDEAYLRTMTTFNDRARRA